MTGTCENCKQPIRVTAHLRDKFCSQNCARAANENESD